MPNITGHLSLRYFENRGGINVGNSGAISSEDRENDVQSLTIKAAENLYNHNTVISFRANDSNYLYKTTGTNQPSSVRILSIVRT